MKKNIFLATIISTICISSAFAGSFGQRYGANGYLTNLPLYYEDGNPKKTANRYNDKATQAKTIQRCSNNSTCTANNPQKTVYVAKQTATDRKRAKLQKKIAKLEKQKYELTQAKNGNTQLTVTG
ncbi:MAG: hypothetical protein P4L31_01955 [Candidatus Babeliales bacterium]|nr:hypothetical protein [Candidatus Babeliales bacterium]